MSSALVLNATYEPLCVVPARRAVVPRARRQGRHHRRTTASVLHSEHLSLAVPSVIRLRYVVKVPFHRRHRSAAGPCSPATTTAASTAASTPTRSTTSCRAAAAASTCGRTSPPRAVRATCASATARSRRHDAPRPAPVGAAGAGVGGRVGRPGAGALGAVPRARTPLSRDRSGRRAAHGAARLHS